MKCKCCERETDDLRFGTCFDCANAESIIEEGLNMWDEPVQKIENMSFSMSKLKEILKIYSITPRK